MVTDSLGSSRRFASPFCRARLKHGAGDPASAVDDAKHGHGVAVVAIDRKIGINDANANAASKALARRSEVRIIAQKPKEVVEQGAVFGGDVTASFRREVVKNSVRVVKSGWREDKPRHYRWRRRKSASMWALYSSSVTTSPRSTWAIASST